MARRGIPTPVVVAAALAVGLGASVVVPLSGHGAAGITVPGHRPAAPVAGGGEWVAYADEVRRGGSVSWRARNPGDIRSGVGYGAVPGRRLHTSCCGDFAIFATEAAGQHAIVLVLQRYGHVTIQQAMGRYSPASDRNDPESYANRVADVLSVPYTRYVDSLTPAQLTQFAGVIRQVEGWTPGQAYRITDPHVPASVRAEARALGH